MNRSSIAGRATIVVLSIGLIASLVLWLYIVIPQVGKDDVMNTTDIKLTVLLLLLLISPYISLIMFLWHFNHSRTSLLVLAAGSFLITAFGIAALADSWYINPDAQSAISLFIVPVFQWIALILLVGICKFVKNRDNEADASDDKD
jgi:hypothetical protein